MKNTVIAIALISGGALCAQDIPASQVPSVVINNFKQQFTDASDVEWEMKGEQYKVEFDKGWFTNDHEAWYDKTGTLLRHEEEITGKELPEAVMNTIKANYAGYKVDDVDKITANGQVTYEVELESRQGDLKKVFDTKGQEIK